MDLFPATGVVAITGSTLRLCSSEGVIVSARDTQSASAVSVPLASSEAFSIYTSPEVSASVCAGSAGYVE